jgi:nuclear inhibitor of protein phosphatase 1
MLGIPDDDNRKGLKRKKKSLTFNEEEEIINPEDIDPSVGRFRNLVQTTVIRASKVSFCSSGYVIRFLYRFEP